MVMKNIISKTKFISLIVPTILIHNTISAENIASVRIDNTKEYQTITGFGGFVCSPQFGYGHMSEKEMNLVWGEESPLGCNIMRLFISDNENSWSQALSAAKFAKSHGLKIFASPWSMPAQWKTNNSTSGVNSNGVIGYLKEANYKDYALFLNRFVKFMHENGIELEAISIQNEPDYDVKYSGCHWTPQQIANFLRDYSSFIECKIMAPETVGLSTTPYVDALASDEIFDKYDIYAGHQYGGIGISHKILAEKGKQIWQSEFLINWNADNNIPERNFNWNIDAFDFAKAINDCMISDVNAWVHYSSKRYYGMVGDGYYGTVSGVLTKRGYILGQFSKYVTNKKRIDCGFVDDSGVLCGSSYISASGDSIITVVINPSSEVYDLTLDLPFYTNNGKYIVTSNDANLKDTEISIPETTFRPKAKLAGSSVTTFIFTKDKDREISNMTGYAVNLNKIDNQIVSNNTFGTSYKLSGTKVLFKHDSPLISNNISNSNSYLKLSERFNQLIFQVKNISSTMNYNAANTTLYYINNKGAVSSHNYGDIVFDKRDNFNLIFNISPEVLKDGCKGLLSLRCGNWSSELTMLLNDVYLSIDKEKSFVFEGNYSSNDSNLSECLEDISYTSLDFRKVSSIPSDEDWQLKSKNKNCVYYISKDLSDNSANTINDNICKNLSLYTDNGNFCFDQDFTAENASLECVLNGFELISIPFECEVPQGVKAFALISANNKIETNYISDNKIKANEPVLVYGNGNFKFLGKNSILSNNINQIYDFKSCYINNYIPVDSYYFSLAENSPMLKLSTKDNLVKVKPFGAYYVSPSGTSINELVIEIDNKILSIDNVDENVYVVSRELYSIDGIKQNNKQSLNGIFISVNTMSDGTKRIKKIYK